MKDPIFSVQLPSESVRYSQRSMPHLCYKRGSVDQIMSTEPLRKVE